MSPNDRHLAVAQLEQARVLLQQRRETLARSQRQLELLLGRYPAGLVQAADLPAVPGPVPAGLPASLLYRRPDLVAAERQVAAADHRVSASRRALLPRIALTGSAGTQSEDVENLLDGDFFVWSVAGNLVQPIFEGSRLLARINANEGQLRVALEQYAQTALEAFGEVETALAVELFLAERQASLARAAEAAESAVRASRDRYEQGIDRFIVVLDARRRSLDAESQLLTVRRLRLESRVNLHLALGDGFGPLAGTLPDAGQDVADVSRTADDVFEEDNAAADSARASVNVAKTGLAVAASQLREAVTQRELQQKTFERYERLLTKNSASPQEFEAAQSSNTSAKVAVERAESQVEAARAQVETAEARPDQAGPGGADRHRRLGDAGDGRRRQRDRRRSVQREPGGRPRRAGDPGEGADDRAGGRAGGRDVRHGVDPLRAARGRGNRAA